MSVVKAGYKEREFMKKTGEKLGAIRSQTTFSQTKIANLADCSKDHVSQIEQGKGKLTAYELLVYCQALHITPNDVMGYGEDETTLKEMQLLYKFRCLSEDKQQMILDMISGGT